jgi:hypothetical protein
MTKIKQIPTLLIWIIFSFSSYGQDLHKEVSAVYNFTPHLMKIEEQKAVYPKLDSFFKLVETNKDKYLEPLRNELKRDDNNPYFYFDGGLLLMLISEKDSDIQLVANALVKTVLQDLDQEIYLEHMLSLSLKGANVIDAALHVLDDTNFKTYIPQHALTLKYATGLKFILPRYQSGLYVKKLISKFNLTKTTDLKITYLDLFIYANCCEADEILSSLVSSDNKKLNEATKEALKWSKVSQKSDQKDYLKYFNKRKSVLNRISDEAGYELDDFTLKMRQSYTCNNK